MMTSSRPHFAAWLASVALTLASASLAGAQSKPIFLSPVVTSKTPGHAVNVDVPLAGAKQLFLVVTDAGDGYACDWADWAEPRVVVGTKEVKLTDLKWKSAQTGWGNIGLNRNVGGGEMKINGKTVEYGIGVHAIGVIAYDLPQGATRFKARCGLDDGGVSQIGGSATSVRFAVYTKKPPTIVARTSAPTRNDAGQREPMDAVANLDVADGLQADLFAAEPMTLSPTNIDVDHRGRVWVCEVVNYRHRNGSRKEGDRILILEDENGDGKADKQTVFYQGRDIDTALGICVLGNKVIVSVAPNVFVFTDEDGDDKADKKEVLFSKVGQPQHDHSTHAFIFGPDGKLYWNVGNTGRAVHDKDGKIIVDLAGNEVITNGAPYRDGMPFRCNLDGSEFETLGWNFRNNYEVTVDSYGGLWQSDNDDDGNRGVRINFVMEFGNYGYKDEITGAGWKSTRTGMNTETPLKHWHLNDPGVVPNLLQTGAGSPCGICVYEGRLLPERFWDQVIHCDAGPNVCRAYPVKNQGAGYSATMENVLVGTRDKWFRPSDVCVAPDGSLIIADWYDPGVGGHRMGDIDRGRIFRVAPPNTPYKIPKFDFSTAEGAAQALRNPNLATRYMAWTALNKMQKKAEPALLALYEKDENPRVRARALWLLGNIKGQEDQYVKTALKDKNADIRMTGLRMARRLKRDLIPLVEQLVGDSSPQVRRECAIALRHHKSSEAPRLWAELAARHDGKDRWYLEALGIGADKQSDAYFEAWLDKVGDDWNTPAGRDLIWRSRAATAMPLLTAILRDPKTESDMIPRYFRAFDFHRPTSPEGQAAKKAALLQLLFVDHPQQDAIRKLSLARLGNVDINSPKLKAAVEKVLDSVQGTQQFIDMVQQFKLKDRYPQVLQMAIAQPDDQLGVEAARALLSANQLDLLRQTLADKDLKTSVAAARALGNSADGRIVGLLIPIVKDAKSEGELRAQAARAVAKTRNGATELIKMAQAKQLDVTVRDAVAMGLHQAQWKDVKQQAEKLFPLPPAKDNKPLPPIAQLLKMRGDVARGTVVFEKTGTCAKCHVVNKMGKEVGPNLSEIGSKLSRQAFFESVLYPSAGISHNYETYSLATTSGNIVTGVIVTQTPDSVTIKGADAIARSFKRSEIEEMVKQKISLMPADLQKTMTAQELVDVVDYLSTLKKK
ncbi:MAG: NPCBM/NEW2 domain-containing protein [Planctomycetales bacterium]